MKIEIIPKVCFSLFVFFTINTNAIFGQTKPDTKPEYYKVSEVRIFINDISDLQRLREQGIAQDKIKLSENYFDVIMDSVQISILKKSGYPYEILIDDITKDYLERTKDSREKIKLRKPGKASGFGYGSMGGFYTFDEVIAQLDTMHLLYPNLITEKDSIGASVEGRTIWAVKISDNPNLNEDEPEIFYNGLIHSSEPEGGMIITYYMYYLLENYGVDLEVTYLVDNRELYFVPVINPDGYIYNEQISPDGGGMWRKNRRNNGDGTFGIDLNRNYGYMWGCDDIGSSPKPVDFNYRGTGPFSEPETQAIREFCINHNFIISCDFHAAWEVIFPPWGHNLEQTPDSIIFNNLISMATSLNGYRNGIYIPSPENSPVNGYSSDWFYGETSEKNKIFSFLVEIGEDKSTWPIPEEIIPLCEENLYSNLVFAWGPGIIEGTSYISDFKINKRYLNPLTDTLQLSSIEYNPKKQNTLVYAEILGEKDTIIDQIQLEKNDSCFSGIWHCNLQEENFYKVRLKQCGTDIPSNFYYNALKFTTAGPVKIDSLAVTKLTDRYRVKPYFKNQGQSYTITNLRITMSSDDSLVINISAPISLTTLPPGETAAPIGNFDVTVDSNFSGIFSFNFDIKSNGWLYWSNSINTVATGVNDKIELPVSFKLYQNYPNPFNPTTKIKYSIPNSERVLIKVFDILGREVKTLLNEYKDVGTYEIEFNASELSSGLYFYKIIAGNYSETRKMIVLR